MAGSRRKARIVALQALYEIDTTKHKPDDVVKVQSAEAELTEENTTFVQELISGVVANRAKIDENIRRFASSWPLEQLSVIDRNILRLAIFEILFDNKVSLKVSINEAVELAKAFGSDNSAKFVNGVLGSVSTLVENTKGE